MASAEISIFPVILRVSSVYHREPSPRQPTVLGSGAVCPSCLMKPFLILNTNREYTRQELFMQGQSENSG